MNGICPENGSIMETPFGAKDQKVLVKYLYFMRNDPTEIHKLLTAACGNNAADYLIVKSWIKELEQGNDKNEEDVPQEGPDGIPTNIFAPDPTDPAAVERIEYLITKDKRIPIDKVAEMSLISKEAAYDIVYGVLGLKRVCERWVPKVWTPEQRSYRVEVAKQLCEKHESGGDDFLKKIIVGDETFIQYYTPDKLPKQVPPHRRGSKDIAETRFRPGVEPIRINIIFFYDCSGLLCVHQVPEKTDVNAEYYANFIKNELVPAIKRKRKNVNIQDLYLLHDNTPIHTSVAVKKVLKEMQLQALPHPPASPDMEPIEYFLIHYLKQNLRHTKFTNALVIGTTVSHHLMYLNEKSFIDSLKTLSSRWESIIDSRGLYVM